VTLQGVDRPIRHALSHGRLRDVDVVNCQPTLLSQALQRCGRECPALLEYVSARDSKLKELVEQYGLERDDAKNVFLRAMYGG
ncbi:hypothetical protein JKP88DRAFT_130868, partial [Tribonema minus]